MGYTGENSMGGGALVNCSDMPLYSEEGTSMPLPIVHVVLRSGELLMCVLSVSFKKCRLTEKK